MTSPDPPPVLLEPFLSAPLDSGIITDFDGTLAPIVAHPEDAHAAPGAVELLHSLAGIYRLVAVVSGRPARFLVDHLGLRTRPGPLQAVGAYGLEWAAEGDVVQHPDVLRWCPIVEEAVHAAVAQAPDGVIVENKTLSLTIHVRTAPQHDGWARSFAEACASTSGLALHEARMSYELRPPLPIDKGSTILSLVDGLKAACFFGDDRGDLPAFDALDRLHADCGAAVLKVAVRSPEAPAELIARADVVVDGPPGVVEVMRALRPGPGPSGVNLTSHMT